MSSNMIKLKSSDGEIFEVEEKVARMSEIVNTLLQKFGNKDDEPVPLLKVKADILKLVLKWADHHKNDPKIEEEDKATAERHSLKIEIPEWDVEFFKIDVRTMLELLEAANFMDMKSLLDLASQSVADMIVNLTNEEVQKIFDVENDLNPDQIAQINKDNAMLGFKEEEDDDDD